MLQEKEAKEKAISSQKKSANERYKEVDKMVADYKFVTPSTAVIIQCV